MLELIFQGFMEWAYGLTLECWQYFSSSLLDIMSMDFAYLKTHVPVIDDIMQVLMAVGWALLIGNLVFQALKSMASVLNICVVKADRHRTLLLLYLVVPRICRPSRINWCCRRKGGYALSTILIEVTETNRFLCSL